MVRPMSEPGPPDAQPTTHFGYSEVPVGEKTARVREVFDSVSSRYDLMNDLMSGGVHRLWKSNFIDQLNPQPGMEIVDVAGGTGDVAQRILTRTNGRARVTICDINASMLIAGRDRAIDKGGLADDSAPDLVCGNAEELPFADASLDAYTIAFGLRNVTHIDKALAEARRVLKPGGHFLCLEFSRVVVPLLAPLYDRYSFTMLPQLGALVARDQDSYVYLAESIRKFPPQEELATMLRDAGFDQVSYRNLSAGIAAVHSAWRI
ncbi:MAG: bifunctional demethylmenaquinone methyltransferase/2-methoxy-6-polyprenyl-1,4-benzoquinol methylase UbiE [Alphaproteobacteria bacterium]|nr:bifunctional demethylmenaquinone methyltransferase/2-methoxy-6-polyprenyl-1,4-benzoquinol methylase UbiE [Alphaproteobacteria bacterium]